LRADVFEIPQPETLLSEVIYRSAFLIEQRKRGQLEVRFDGSKLYAADAVRVEPSDCLELLDPFAELLGLSA
jgi:hypothetical protein